MRIRCKPIISYLSKVMKPIYIYTNMVRHGRSLCIKLIIKIFILIFIHNEIIDSCSILMAWNYFLLISILNLTLGHLLIWYRRNLDQGLVGGKIMMKFEEMSKKIK